MAVSQKNTDWADTKLWVSALKDSIGLDPDKSRRKHSIDLVDHALVRVPQDARDRRSPDEWSNLIGDAVDRLLAQRRPGIPQVEVFRPDVDTHGWEAPTTVIQVLTDDMPFLVDSVSLAVSESDLDITLILHPLLRTKRDEQGVLRTILPRNDTEAVKESFIHIELDRPLSSSATRKLQKQILSVLDDVRRPVEDWHAMLARLTSVRSEVAASTMPFEPNRKDETLAFLDWLRDDNFTFLGHLSYEAQSGGMMVANESSALGLLRDPERRAQARSVEMLRPTEDGYPLTLTKTGARGTVHRPGYMDYVGVPRYDENAQPIGEHRFIGLYTSTAYTRRPWRIPVVRAKVEAVIETSGVARDSHAGKALLNILETLPRDELFQASGEQLRRFALGILDLQERSRTKLFVRRDPFNRFYACLVFIPRERFNTERRIKIAAILKRALKGRRVDFRVQVDESPLARLYIVVRTPSDLEQAPALDEIEKRIRSAVQSWEDQFEQSLVNRLGLEAGGAMARRYDGVFPAAYMEDVTPRAASFDIGSLDGLSDDSKMALSLYQPRKRVEGQYRFKIFCSGNPLALTDVLPVLENMGVRVISERPYRVDIKEGSARWIQDFDIVVRGNQDIDLGTVRKNFQTAFEKQILGAGESDLFNRLIVVAALNWGQVVVLRACCKYLLQAGSAFSLSYMANALANHPTITKDLVTAFELRFNPVVKGDRPTLIKAMDERIVDQVESVSSLDDDRIIRAFHAVIAATLRTNHYRKVKAAALSFKIDSSRILNLPDPRPYREIFVYSPEIEGIHLRGGPVARGGLRWSDRQEDFRTEVLGLMKAQMVKNTVIVPVGAKGGFVVKQLPQVRAEVADEVERCYRIFINSLLDVTDNLDGEKIEHPDDVIFHDDADPYLVVAADKGTATFSDTANEIAQDRGFWLGDAFASGGSVGYDHKKMGITAKGAWESVKRHFREMGVDCQNEDFTVVGIGDMAGDVFGNGMLLSKHIRLQAAFNHLHIFLDPNPDARTSYPERERLFGLPRSSWEDYDPNLISKGGGVFSRQSKTIPLSSELRDWLGIDADELPPNQLITQLLKAPCDLLWNGGIGTYVKSSGESHETVGDRANNNLRVDGAELGCAVVGEGGNLGLTQRGRIEFARAGGRINSDFIDNSAGVDCSDHEVNIKILLNEALAKRQIDVESRAQLLREMTDEVASHVLRNNYLQSQAISLLSAMSASRIGSKAHYIDHLETRGLLRRDLESLPTQAALEELRLRNQGLTRPELATLLSYSKIELYQDLLQTDLPEDEFLNEELVNYFPKQLGDRYVDLMSTHRLRREIITSAVTNSVVNRMGTTFVLRMIEDTGANCASVVRAYAVARRVLDARRLWAQIEALDETSPWAAQLDAFLTVWECLRASTRWLLLRRGALQNMSSETTRYGAGVVTLRESLNRCLTEAQRELVDSATTQKVELGLPEELARELALLPLLDGAMDIVDVAEAAGTDVVKTGANFFAVGQRLRLDFLHHAAEQLVVEGEWHAQARAELRDRLARAHHNAAVGAVASGIEFTRIASPKREADYFALLQSMQAHGVLDYAMIGVAAANLEALIAASTKTEA